MALLHFALGDPVGGSCDQLELVDGGVADAVDLAQQRLRRVHHFGERAEFLEQRFRQWLHVAPRLGREQHHLQEFVVAQRIGAGTLETLAQPLAMAWKWQRGDVSRHTGGDLASALGRIKAKTYVMPISHDMFFPPSDCEVEQRLIPGSEFRPLKSSCGHLGLFGVDPELLAQLDANLNELLAAPVN